MRIMNPLANKPLEYLISLATEHALSEALDIGKKNEHYKVDSMVWCCTSDTTYPSDLIRKLDALSVGTCSREGKNFLVTF